MWLLRTMFAIGGVLGLAACNNDEVWQTDGVSGIPDDEDTQQGAASGWSAEVVADGSRSTGIAVDADGKIHISCYDGFAEKLMYAHK
jgi:hypothetical protein